MQNSWKFCAAAVLGLFLIAPTTLAAGNAKKGEQVYRENCTVCHNFDPTKPGAIGPALKGSPAALLEARVMKGAYPPGYKPKRRTTIMPPYPHLKEFLADLAAYLK